MLITRTRHFFYLVVIYVMCLFPVCRMKLLKGCLDGSTSTAWDYAGLICNLYRDAVLKQCASEVLICTISCVTSSDHRLKRPRCRPKTLPPFSNLSCPIPYQSFSHIVHVADWIVPLFRSQHSPPPLLKFFHTPPSAPPPYVNEVRGQSY